MSTNGWRGKTAGAGTVVGVLIGAVVIWEGAVRLLGIQPILLPSPSIIVMEMIKIAPWLCEQTVYTVLETLAGFAMAVLFGVALAVLIVSSKLVEKTIYTLLVAFNSVPKVAVAPLFIVWMGTGASPKVAMALFIGIFAIVVDTVQGLRSVEPDMIDLARSLGGDRFQMLTKIRLYCALPSLFAGMKVAISLALVGAIIGEFVASSDGLGYVILTAEGNFDTPQIFAALVVLAVVGTIMFYAIDLTERACLPWHVSRRRD
jgi:NitT/TauT family transport system permease protein